MASCYRICLLILLCTGTTALAESAPQALLPERPAIEDYADHEQFVVDVLAWERNRAQIMEKIRTGEISKNAADSAATDWHQVTGPEDLDTALSNAEGYQQPHYQQTLRFNRTTHISFPLRQLPADQLANKRVEGNIPETDLEMDTLVKELADSATDLEQLAAPLRPETVEAPGVIRSRVESVLR